MMDLEQMMANALAKVKLDGPEEDLVEVVPGVTYIEAKVAAGYAMMYGGFTTPEIEAPRIAADRARAKRYDQCDETCTTDCGHCKGRVAWGRPETDPCERGTVGCSVKHGRNDTACETW